TLMATSRTATREIEGRDSVGLYLYEIARTPLLDAITEVELSKTIEAGLLAEHLLAEGRIGRRKGGAPDSRLSLGVASGSALFRAGSRKV
ncbi:MAG: sigma-70 family polymerase sigma factor, partial [Nocardioidaceae bacterium]|nr:sigma-70 family polymerase sigma factor [Nocardioidaceae bacterium]